MIFHRYIIVNKAKIDPGANPCFCKARPVPYAYCSKVEAELDGLIEQNIIEPIPFSLGCPNCSCAKS